MQDTKPDQQRVEIGSAGHRARADAEPTQVQSSSRCRAPADAELQQMQIQIQIQRIKIAASHPPGIQLACPGGQWRSLDRCQLREKLPRKRSSSRISAARDQSRVRGRPNGLRSGSCLRAALRIWTPIHSDADISSRFAISFSSSASSTVNEIVTGRHGNCVRLAIA